jgi:amino acid transporter
MAIGDQEGRSALPLFSRKATGLVREVSLLQMVAFNGASTNALGLGLVIFSFALVLFPRANPFIAIAVAGILCVSVWTSFALLSAAIPRVGGDYTINTRILPPWLALGGNIGAFLAGIVGAPLFAYELSAAAISPAFTVIGSVTNSSTFTRLGGNLLLAIMP